MAKQGVYTEDFKGAELNSSLNFVPKPLLHCVWT